MPPRVFCTYFDANYLPRALALHASLRRHAGAFRLYALCHDEPSLAALRTRADPSLVPIGIADLERHDPALAATKGERNRVEYYFTCTPALCRYVLDLDPTAEWVTYLDADLYFFDAPDALFTELTGYSVGIIEHRFTPRVRRYRRFGRFNVGWVGFRNDAAGRTCLDWWRARCLEWCFDRVEGDRYADQKYLDAFTTRFEGIRIIENTGANVAPWNAGRYRFSMRDGRVMVDGAPLVFFHFAGLRELRPWLYRAGFGAYLTVLGPTVRRRVYHPYIRELRRHAVAGGSAERIRNTDRRLAVALQWLKGMVRTLRGIVCLEYVLASEASDEAVGG